MLYSNKHVHRYLASQMAGRWSNEVQHNPQAQDKLVRTGRDGSARTVRSLPAPEAMRLVRGWLPVALAKLRREVDAIDQGLRDLGIDPDVDVDGAGPLSDAEDDLDDDERLPVM